MTLSENDCLKALRPGRMYLWTALTHDQSVSGLRAVLSTDEQKRAGRFMHAQHAQQFIIAHALARLALSYHFPAAPHDWHFESGGNGKPFIASPEVSPAVQFSLSHTDGLVACLITLSAEAAVDVEKIEYNRDLRLVARHILSPNELNALNALPNEDWAARFFSYWTLKEANAKATGAGLALLLNDIGLDLGGNWVNENFISLTDQDSSVWLLWRDYPQSEHAVSLAVKKDFDCECEIIHRRAKFNGARIASMTDELHVEPSKGSIQLQGRAMA